MKMTPALWTSIRRFKPREFNRPELMDLELLQKLDHAREVAGIPFVIGFEAYRTEAHNSELDGAAKNSAHLRGYAVDIQVRAPRNRFLILRGLIIAGFTRIGDRYDAHIHVDCDPTLDQSVAW